MNVKTLRKNYDALSFRERFSLFDKATNRKDESELDAILAASPKLVCRMVDFARFSESVLVLHLENLLERLSWATMFDLFSTADTSKLTDETFERISNSLLMAGYFYTIETDAWAGVGDEYGFDVQGFRQKMAKNYFAVYVMETKDELMREVSFDEEAMKQTAKEKYAEIANGSIEIKTLYIN